MPELPEAETIARLLRRRLVGRRIVRARLARRDILHGDPWRAGTSLRGRRVREVTREGKRVRLDLSGGTSLVFALGMTGQLTLAPTHEPLLPHTHLRVGLDRSKLELRFRDPRRFGGVWLLNDSRRRPGRRPPPLGPDPMTISWHSFADLLATRRQIKALLLDQRRISGLGNIYVDEALFASRIHPRTPASRLDGQDAKRLLRNIRRILRQAIDAGGSTIRDYRGASGEPGGFQRRHQVYGRAGKPCRRCGTPLRRILVAGRGTTLCPRCQSPPA